MSNITGDNIRRLRRQRGLTVEQLAELVKGSPHFTTIARFERGKQALTAEWMARIAEALGVSPADLMQDGDYAPARRVPLVGKITGGNWREAVLDAAAMVPCDEGGPNTFALTLDGDSIDKVVAPGSRVYIDPDDFDLRDGKFYAVMNSGGETTCKRYRSNPMQFEPVSNNPAHQPILVGREPFTVVGRVIRHSAAL